jgi:hypothetical protein
MIEEWKDIIGYEGLYQISNLGRVKSLSRVYVCGNGRTVNKKETIISQQKNNHGYLYCFLYNGDKKIKYIHILVGLHFIENENNYPQINHLDLNKENNIISNLEWVTNQQNTIHQYSLKRDLPTGVSKRGNRYIAQTTIQGKKKHIGSFSTIELAKNAYQLFTTPIATNPC